MDFAESIKRKCTGNAELENVGLNREKAFFLYSCAVLVMQLFFLKPSLLPSLHNSPTTVLGIKSMALHVLDARQASSPPLVTFNSFALTFRIFRVFFCCVQMLRSYTSAVDHSFIRLFVTRTEIPNTGMIIMAPGQTWSSAV